MESISIAPSYRCANTKTHRLRSKYRRDRGCCLVGRWFRLSKGK
jgi:hypothetical protein